MTRQLPASGLVLRQYDDKAYRVHDRTTGTELGCVIAWYSHWTAYRSSRVFILLPIGDGRTRSDALHAAWPEKWPTRPAQPPDPAGRQSGKGDCPNGPQNGAQTGAA